MELFKKKTPCCNTISYLKILRYYQQIELEYAEAKNGCACNVPQNVSKVYFDLSNYLNAGNLRHVVHTLLTEEGLTPKKFGEKINHTEKEVIDLLNKGLITPYLLTSICDYYGLVKTASFSKYVTV